MPAACLPACALSLLHPLCTVPPTPRWLHRRRCVPQRSEPHGHPLLARASRHAGKQTLAAVARVRAARRRGGGCLPCLGWRSRTRVRAGRRKGGAKARDTLDTSLRQTRGARAPHPSAPAGAASPPPFLGPFATTSPAFAAWRNTNLGATACASSRAHLRGYAPPGGGGGCDRARARGCERRGACLAARSGSAHRRVCIFGAHTRLPPPSAPQAPCRRA